MPDFNPGRGAGQGPVRRPRGHAVHYGPGGLPTEGADPPPKPWPIAPWLAAVFCVGFLALQLWPATHFRHPRDPSRTWHPIIRNEDGSIHPQTLVAAREKWGLYSDGGSDAKAILATQTQQFSEEREASDRTESHELLKRRKEQYVQIFLCSDEQDLRPLAVVINSTISNARYPERLKFYLLIPTSESKLELHKLTSFFHSTNIEIVSEGIDLGKISKLVQYRDDSKARKELATLYNFIPYYFPHWCKEKGIEKFIYLDTDTVVKGDIEELYSKGLEGYPIAAVRDCSQRFKNYFNFNLLREILTKDQDSQPWLPKKPFDEQECIFNRGALLIDVKQWIEQNVTGAIEWWMGEDHKSTEALYTYGVSQPPFLLALHNNYKELDHTWNIRGLGRDEFSILEQDFMAEFYGHRPIKKPFLSLESDYAKILHFNGKFKPWRRDRLRLPTENVISLCGQEGLECYKLWWEYLSPAANEAFKPSTKH